MSDTISLEVQKLLQEALDNDNDVSNSEKKKEGTQRKVLTNQKQNFTQKVKLFVCYCRLAQTFRALTNISELRHFSCYGLTLCLIRLFHLFTVSMEKVSTEITQTWDKVMVDFGYSQQDCFVPSPGHLAQKSRKHQLSMRLKKIQARNLPMALKRKIKQSTSVLEMDLDTACTIIQMTERVRQSKARAAYLRKVREKAFELSNGTTSSETSVESAAIIIQAKTRTYLTKKRVRNQKFLEDKVLGLSLQQLIEADVDTEAISMAASSLERIAVSEFAVISALGNIRKKLEKGMEPRQIQDSKHSKMKSKTGTARPIRPTPGDIVKHGLLQTNSNDIELMSKLASYRMEFLFQNASRRGGDMKNILTFYCVMPLVIKKLRKTCDTLPFSILLIGELGSGKSEWTRAIAAAACADLVKIQPKVFKYKRIKIRKKLVTSVLKFCQQETVVLSLDRLEAIGDSNDIIKQKYLAHYKTALEKFLTTRSSNSILIGMCRKSNTELESMFDMIIWMSSPPAEARFKIITRRLKQLSQQNLQSEKNALNMSQLISITEGFTCGQVLTAVDRKIRK